MKRKIFNILLPIATLVPVLLIFIFAISYPQDPIVDSIQDTTLKTVVLDTTPNDTIVSDITHVKEPSNRKEKQYEEWKKNENIDLRQQRVDENLNEMDKLKMKNDSILKEMKKR